MRGRSFAGPVISRLAAAPQSRFVDHGTWQAHLQRLGIDDLQVMPDPMRVATDCRDAFPGPMHTCSKLGIAFWDYLGNRLDVAGQSRVPALADLIHCRGQPA